MSDPRRYGARAKITYSNGYPVMVKIGHDLDHSGTSPTSIPQRSGPSHRHADKAARNSERPRSIAGKSVMP